MVTNGVSQEHNASDAALSRSGWLRAGGLAHVTHHLQGGQIANAVTPPAPPPPPPPGEFDIFVPGAVFEVGLGVISRRVTPTQLRVVNGTPGRPLTWSVVSGSFGGSVTLSPSGLISGSRGDEGGATVTIRVTDGQQTVTRTIRFFFVFVLEGAV